MVTRSPLPQNYIILPAINLFEDFETGWAKASTYGTVTNNTSEYKTGTQSIKLAVGAEGTVVSAAATRSIPALNTAPSMEIWAYSHSLDPYTEVQSITVFLATVSNFSKTFQCVVNGKVLVPGWNCVYLAPSIWTASGGAVWTDPIVKLDVRVDANATFAPALSFDSMYVNRQSLPSCMITFDDQYKTVISSGALAYMEARGILGTWFTNGAIVIQALAAWLTLAELQSLYATGHCIANHTWNHTNLNTLTTPEIQAAVGDQTAWLLSNGMPRGAHLFAYPGGITNAAIVSTVAGCSILAARATIPAYLSRPAVPLWQIPVTIDTGLTTLTQAQTAIDNAIRDGTTVVFMIHGIAASGATTIEKFRGIIDYIVQKKIRTLTFDEWYNGLTNPRYQNIPSARTAIGATRTAR